MTRGPEPTQGGEGGRLRLCRVHGGLLSAATLMVKRIRGIRRAALAPVVPNATGNMVLIDCGATAECTPEYLLQFASWLLLCPAVFGHPEPPGGPAEHRHRAQQRHGLQKAAHALLTQAHEAGRIHFIGNIEGREAISQGVDVLVTDGFTGNIFLKTMEGAASLFTHALKDMLLGSTKTKLAALLLKDSLAGFKKRFDANEVGGTALLGDLPTGDQGPWFLQRICLLQRHPPSQGGGRGGHCGRHRRQRRPHEFAPGEERGMIFPIPY